MKHELEDTSSAHANPLSNENVLICTTSRLPAPRLKLQRRSFAGFWSLLPTGLSSSVLKAKLFWSINRRNGCLAIAARKFWDNWSRYCFRNDSGSVISNIVLATLRLP